tara:strand:- start:448 stop:885 length:438 start_codon:yes stop_codon:yes gene_type:complete
MAKLTEEELRKIIQEELEDIDEGAFDRFLARSRGKLSKGASGISNIGKGIAQTFKGEKPTGRADIEKVRKYSTALSIINSAAKRVLPALDAMKEDLETMMEEDKSLADIGAFGELVDLSNNTKTLMNSIQNTMSRNLKNMKKKGK